MLKHYILLLTLFVPGLGIAQGIYNNGAYIVITNGSNVYIDGNTVGGYRSESSGLIKNSTAGGTITLKGNWNNRAGNTGFTGTTGETVVLGGSSTQVLKGTSGTTFYKLNATGGGTKIDSGGVSISNLLTLANSTTYNSNGNTTLLATATTNGQVAAIPSGSSVTNDMKVQIFFTGGTSAYRGTRVVSAPIDETSLSSKTYAQLKNYVIITGPGTTNNSNGFDKGGASAPYGVTLNKYNEPATLSQSQFTPVATLGDALSKGNGVLMFYRGDRSNYSEATALTSNKVNAPYATPESTTMQWTGPINQGDVTVNLSYTNNSGEPSYNGYNLVGNPYPATIDWTLVTKNNVGSIIRVIKAGGGMATYSDTASINGGVRYIAPGQGFYVKANGSGASITFTESAKVTSATPGRFLYSGNKDFLLASGFEAPKVSSAGIRLLRMNLQDDANKDETVALFQSGQSFSATSSDVIFMGGSTVSLSTISSDNQKLTINYMPELQASTEVKLSISSTNSGSMKLNFTDLTAVDNSNLYLKDAYLDKIVDVKAEPTYSFTIDKNVASTFGDNRLSLIITPISTLPVKISAFKAAKAVAGAKLSWNVSSETKVARYEVERSANSTDFVKLAEVVDLGKASYTVYDANPAVAQNYYRIKIYDDNGTFNYSAIASVDYSLSAASVLSVYPNPASDVVMVKLPEAKAVHVSIIDLAGREVKSADISSTSLVQQNISDLQKGLYIIQISDSKSKEVLLKEKFGVER